MSAPAKAVMPEKTNLVKPANHAARTSSAAMNTHAPECARQVAKADVAGDRVNTGPEQQWVVLAAWEEVRTVSHVSSEMTSDYEANAVVEDGAAAQTPDNTTTGQGTTAAQAASKTPYPNQTSSQYTVTRLILKVVPANSNSTQPATGMMRGGWFVIQL